MFGDIKHIKMLDITSYKCKDKIEINCTDKFLV
jgi:hypothetical protein